MVYVPTSKVFSKWYGESERNLAEIFDACQELSIVFGQPVLVFIDEIDALAPSRGTHLHEESRKVLSVLLAYVDGLDSTSSEATVLLVGATNRQQDCDPALLSRFETVITFGLPSRPDRQAIFQYYARHLLDGQLQRLAEESEGFSGRDIKNACTVTERRWMAQVLALGTPARSVSPPPAYEYSASIVDQRVQSAAGSGSAGNATVLMV
eukprot:EG_transcript_24432